MLFHVTPNVHVRTDDDGKVRHVRHQQEPYAGDAAGVEGPTPVPLALAELYVRDIASLYAIPDAELTDLYAPVSQLPTTAGTKVQAAQEKRVMDTVVVTYQQTHLGLPIWEAELSVRVQTQPMRVTSSTSTLHFDVEVDPANTDAIEGFAAGEPNAVRSALKISGRTYRGLQVNSTRLLIYRYDPEARYDAAATPPAT